MAHPGDRLPLLDRAVEHPQQGEAAQEGRGVEVGDPRLQGCFVVVGRRGDVPDDGIEQRFEVKVVRQFAIGRLVPAGGAVATGGVNDGNIEDGIEIEVREVILHVRGESQQQVLALADHLVDAGVGPVRLVDQQHDGQLGLERLAQHEAGLRQRPLARVDQQYDAVDHGQAALDLTTEIGVAGGVDHVDRDRALGCVNPAVGDRRVLRQDRDALLPLELVGVHGALFEVRVRREGVGLTQHGVHERGLAMVDVGDDRHVAQV